MKISCRLLVSWKGMGREGRGREIRSNPKNEVLTKFLCALGQFPYVLRLYSQREKGKVKQKSFNWQQQSLNIVQAIFLYFSFWIFLPYKKKNKICGLCFFFLISGMQHFCGRVRSGFWVILTSLFLLGKKKIHSFFPRHDFCSLNS